MRALAEIQQEADQIEAAAQARGQRELGRPLTPKEVLNGFQTPETRGPHEIAADRQAAAGCQFDPYAARLAVMKSQGITSKEAAALEAKSAAFVPQTPAPAAPETSPYATAIAALESKPIGDKASTDRQIANLRRADEAWKQDQAREAELKARAERPEFINAVANSEASYRTAQLLPNVPEAFVTGAAERMKALKATGDVAKYFADTRAAETALNEHFDSIKADFNKKQAQLDADRKAALSTSPVEVPVVEAPPPTVIEQALMGGSPGGVTQ
ncbi:MAG TPA: hypothetical protein VGM05_33020 [Planctomycetaceae bacterium]|jgi:hypothetical protein